MRTYEALYIVRPDLDDETIQTVAQGVESLIVNNGGAIVRLEIWGKRRLAYPVQKCSEGFYVLLRFNANPDFVARLENHFRIEEPIIRFLIVHFDEQTLRLEAEQQKRQEEQLRGSAAGRRRSGDPRPGRRGDRDDDDDDTPETRDEVASVATGTTYDEADEDED